MGKKLWRLGNGGGIERKGFEKLLFPRGRISPLLLSPHFKSQTSNDLTKGTTKNEITSAKDNNKLISVKSEVFSTGTTILLMKRSAFVQPRSFLEKKKENRNDSIQPICQESIVTILYCSIIQVYKYNTCMENLSHFSNFFGHFYLFFWS